MAYYQAHKPLVEQEDAVGHAVRALYLYAGLADVARETGEQDLLEACDRLWKSVTQKRMYITGAVGSSRYGEAFTFDLTCPTTPSTAKPAPPLHWCSSHSACSSFRRAASMPM